MEIYSERLALYELLRVNYVENYSTNPERRYDRLSLAFA